MIAELVLYMCLLRVGSLFVIAEWVIFVLFEISALVFLCGTDSKVGSFYV